MTKKTYRPPKENPEDETPEPITYYVATKVTEVQVSGEAAFAGDLPSTVKLISFAAEVAERVKAGTAKDVELAEAAISGIGDATYTFAGTEPQKATASQSATAQSRASPGKRPTATTARTFLLWRARTATP